MNELEVRVQETLRERAGEPVPRTMPPATVRRVRARQARFSAGVAAVLVVALAAGAGALSLLPRTSHGGPAGGAYGSMDGYRDLPPGWSSVTTTGHGLVPTGLTFSGASAEVILSGIVDGSSFTFVASTSQSEGACLDLVGPGEVGGDAIAGGEIGACSGAVETPVPTAKDLDMLGFQSAPRPDHAGYLGMANFGFASERVARLEVTLSDGTAVLVPILGGPDGWGVKAFVFFPPVGATGDLVAYDDGGNRLASAPLCSGNGVPGGCRTETNQLVPPGPDGSPQP